MQQDRCKLRLALVTRRRRAVDCEVAIACAWL
jgi:hypothetical protein